jgi:putative FmdB family regulatory protein
MPLYEYKCTKCGSVFEFFQKVNDPSPKKCSKCQGPLKKVLSPPALQFRGSGWYVTDYASKSAQPSESDSKAKTKKDKEPSEEKEKPSAPVSKK